MRFELGFRQNVSHVITAAIFFVIGVVAVLVYPFPLSNKDAIIKVRYGRYACGDCYVQYRVLGVNGPDGGPLLSTLTPDDRKGTPARYLGWDILVFHKGNSAALTDYLESHFDRSGHCAEPLFRLQGQMKKRLIYALLYRGEHYDGTYFDARTAVAIRESDPACTQKSGEEAL